MDAREAKGHVYLFSIAAQTRKVITERGVVQEHNAIEDALAVTVPTGYQSDVHIW